MPVLTPRETPQGSQSLLLLSPSRTITQSLKTLATSTAQQLEEVWDDVGYNPEERASQLKDLLVKFKDLCEEKIKEEHRVAETFRQTITEAKEEIRKTSAALKALVDPQLLRDNSDLTLTDELAALENALETLRADAEVARKELKEHFDFLVESHAALGITLHDKWTDIESDLTASRRQDFHLKVSEMKDELSTRTSAVIQLLRDCQHLMNDLSIDSENGSEFDRKIAGSLVRSKDSSFMMASRFETDTCTGISSKSLEALTNRATEMSGEKKRRKARLQEMGGEIAMLWEQLRIPEEDQRSFTESVKGLGMDTIEKGEVELARLMILKSEMIGSLVSEARDTIRSLWEETNATETLRQSFAPMNVDDESAFDDDLLEKHEDYIRVLKSRLEKMKPILRIIEMREDILRERMEYEDFQKDPGRLRGRGATKQLMKEEKMARRIKRDLPKLTKVLEEKLVEWKEENGEDFLYRGEMYVDVMGRQDEEWNSYKKEEMQMKIKKTQAEQALEENKFLGKPSHPVKKTTSGRPLGDLQSRENKRASSRTRPRDGVSKPSRTAGFSSRGRATVS